MEDNQNYYTRNKQARKEYQRKDSLENKERIKAKRRLEELQNPERFEERKDYNKNYYIKNREKILQRRAEAYAKKKAGVGE